jgi:hypothetical protein
MCLQAGSCLYLIGNGAYVDMAPPDYIQFPGQLSLTVWFKHEAIQFSSNWARLFECNNGEQKDLFTIAQESASTRAVFEVRGTSYRFDNGFPSGTWVHYVWTLSKSDAQGNAKWRIYKNGVYLASYNGLYPVPTSTCYIGKSAGSAESPFKGRIYTFAFYPYILSSEDVQLVYQSTGLVVRVENAFISLVWIVYKI